MRLVAKKTRGMNLNNGKLPAFAVAGDGGLIHTQEFDSHAKRRGGARGRWAITGLA